MASSERVANFFARRLQKRGAIPEDAEVEHITSLEQAEKYVQPMQHDINVGRLRMPDLVDLLSKQMPDGAELLEGKAKLWKERRIPTPYVYFAGLGRLLADVEYNPTEGWQNTH
jgi:hypothetical protein